MANKNQPAENIGDLQKGGYIALDHDWRPFCVFILSEIDVKSGFLFERCVEKMLTLKWSF
jgi:hypothetical protein